MSKLNSILVNTLIMITLLFMANHSRAEDALLPTQDLARPTPSSMNQPLTIPSPPAINAKAFILIDTDSGKIIAEKNSEEKLPPASLTKMMTLYVISKRLHDGQIKLDDEVRVSKEAWKTGGSRMFIKEGDTVSVENLLKGIIVDSGNDSCVAMAEHVGGSENSFSDLMNSMAKNLGMNSSHFTDSTGLPNPDHYTTARDLAILGRSLVNDFPEYYGWYKQKWFSYNGIRQPNRNRLLWRDTSVDGLKTGHTDEAGFCLVSSAKRGNMRLLAVVLGEPSESARADDSEKLLNYGFRFYETHALYKANKPISDLAVYKGADNNLPIALNEDLFVTIFNGQYQHLSITTKAPAYVKAPIAKGDQVGELVIQFDGKVVSTKPLYAMQDVPSGGFFKRSKDSVKLFFKKWTS